MKICRYQLCKGSPCCLTAIVQEARSISSSYESTWDSGYSVCLLYRRQQMPSWCASSNLAVDDSFLQAFFSMKHPQSIWLVACIIASSCTYRRQNGAVLYLQRQQTHLFYDQANVTNLFPFYSTWRLTTNIINYSINSCNLINDT